MKNVALVGILAVSSLLAVGQATHTPKSATTKSATPESDTTQIIINIVRNGYLEYNKTTTIGQALAGTFQVGEWKAFKTEKGAIIVEFDGSQVFGAFGEFDSTGDQGGTDGNCEANLICMALWNKLDADCRSNADALGYKTTYDNLTLQLSAVNQQIDDLDKQLSNTSISDYDRVRDNLYRKDGKYEELGKEREQLQNRLRDLKDPSPACFNSACEQNVKDPIPITVQFSINYDGTFQYEANDMGLSVEALFKKIYK